MKSENKNNKPIKTDLKDKKLLLSLDFNARSSYSELAKLTGLSKQGVEYKLNNLIKKGIIKGFYPVINCPKLGYLYCRLSLVLKNIKPEEEKELLNYLSSSKSTLWVFTTQGVFDILAGYLVKSITEFKSNIEELLKMYGKYIKYKNESVTTEVIHFQHRYLLNKRETREINIKEVLEKVEIDETDKKILKELAEDARSSLIRIANNIKISSKVVSYRIRRMEKINLIEGYRPEIDHNKLGYTYYKLWININYEDFSGMKKLYSYIKENPIVLFIVKGSGFPEDLDIEIMVKDNQELFSFIKELKLKFPNLIGDYKAFTYLETKKVRYLPF